ncbi:hypothetical protein D3C75_646090 [compost metagenome]
MNGFGILLFPGPYLLQEFLAAEIMACNPLLAQLLLHFSLGGDPGMVRSRQPEGIKALHPLGADQDILKREVKRMADVQHACYVRRRNHNAVRLGIRPLAGLEEFILHPVGVPFLLCRLRIICSRHFALGVIVSSGIVCRSLRVRQLRCRISVVISHVLNLH